MKTITCDFTDDEIAQFIELYIKTLSQESQHVYYDGVNNGMDVLYAAGNAILNEQIIKVLSSSIGDEFEEHF